MSEAAPAAAAAPAAPNNKMMFIMMGVMFLVLLGGMGGMFVMMNKKTAATTEEAKTEEHEEGKAEGKEGDKGGPKAAAIYIGFEPPFVANFPASSVVKFLQVTVQVMTREATVEHEIKANDPAIRDALLTLFGQQTADQLATVEGKEELRAKALEAVRGVISHEGGEADKVEAVYFTSFVMQ